MQLGDLSMCNDSAPLALQGRFRAQTWSNCEPWHRHTAHTAPMLSRLDFFEANPLIKQNPHMHFGGGGAGRSNKAVSRGFLAIGRLHAVATLCDTVCRGSKTTLRCDVLPFAGAPGRHRCRVAKLHRHH